MAVNKITLREFQKKYRAGDFLSKDFKVQVEAGWYDWFCEDAELSDRLAEIWKILDGITNDWVLDNFRIWFKNDCSADEVLYDDVRFEPLDESKRDEWYFLIEVHDEAYLNRYKNCQKYETFTIQGGFGVGFDDIKDVIDWANNREQEVRG